MEQSIGQISETHISIQKIKSTLKANQYNLINLNNGATVGELSVSNFYLTKSLTTSLEIIHQDPYAWEVLTADKGFSIFTNKIWSKFYGRLYNSTQEATFMWDFQDNEPYRFKLEEIPVTGEANLTNPNNHFLLFAGMFLMEMELQMRAVD